METGTLVAVIVGPILFILAGVLLYFMIKRTCCANNNAVMAPSKIRKAGGFDNPLYSTNPLDNAVSMKNLMMNTAETTPGVYGSEQPSWTPLDAGFFAGQLSLDLQPSPLEMQPPGGGPGDDSPAGSFANPMFYHDSTHHVARQSSVDLFVDRSPVSDLSSSFEDGYMVIHGVTTSESGDDGTNKEPENNGRRKVRFSEANIIHIPEIIPEGNETSETTDEGSLGQSPEHAKIGSPVDSDKGMPEYAQVARPKDLPIPEINIICATPPSGLYDKDGYLVPKPSNPFYAALSENAQSVDKSDDSIEILDGTESICIEGVTTGESSDTNPESRNDPVPEPVYSEIGEASSMFDPISIDTGNQKLEESSDSIVKIDSNEFSPDISITNPLYQTLDSPGSGIIMANSQQSSPNSAVANENNSSDDIIKLNSPQPSSGNTSWDLISDFAVGESDKAVAVDDKDRISPDIDETPLDHSFDDIMSKAWDFTGISDSSFVKNKEKTSSKQKKQEDKQGFINLLYNPFDDNADPNVQTGSLINDSLTINDDKTKDKGLNDDLKDFVMDNEIVITDQSNSSIDFMTSIDFLAGPDNDKKGDDSEC